MNEHDPIEMALEKLRPKELESPLMERLTAARPHGESAGKKPAWHGLLLRWLLPVAASACVAAATFVFLERGRSHDAQTKTAAANEPSPVESRDYLVSAQPVGIVIGPNQKPYRIMDVQWLEYETVRAGANGPALHTATTRRDVIPVALEIY